jgi:hypothetical protein
MLELVVSLNNMTDIPHVLSLSFGWEEYDQCDSQFTGTDCHGWTAAEYIKRANVEFAKLVARGVSVIVASGDQGAAGELNNQCWRPAGQQRKVEEYYGMASNPLQLALSSLLRHPGSPQYQRLRPLFSRAATTLICLLCAK